MLGLKSFRTASNTFSGIEFAHRVRKRQFALAPTCGALPEHNATVLAQWQGSPGLVKKQRDYMAGVDVPHHHRRYPVALPAANNAAANR